MNPTLPLSCLAALLLLLTACADAEAPPAGQGTAGAAANAPSAPSTAAPSTAAPSTAAPSAAAPSTTAAKAANGLGVTQEQIVAVFGARGFDPNAFENQTLPDGRQVMAAAYPASSERQVLWVGIFGPAEAPHTVRVDYAPVNTREGEPQAVGQAMDGLMTTLFPDWPQAATWPEQVGERTWREAAELAKNDPGSRRIPILEGQRETVWLGALGAPPQVISYVFTTHDECRPSKTAADFYRGYSGCR